MSFLTVIDGVGAAANIGFMLFVLYLTVRHKGPISQRSGGNYPPPPGTQI